MRRKQLVPALNWPLNARRREPGRETVPEIFDVFCGLTEELPIWVAATKSACVLYGSATDVAELSTRDVVEMRLFFGVMLCVCCAGGAQPMRELWKTEDGLLRPAWKLGSLTGMSRHRFESILRHFTPSCPYTLEELKVSGQAMLPHYHCCESFTA